MDLRELVMNHPALLAAGCFAWIIVLAWVMMLIHRMIMQDVDFLTGTISIGLVFGLGLMSIHAPKPYLQPLSIGLLYSSGIMLPIIRGFYNRREVRNSDVEGVKIGYEGLVLRPNNPTAMIRIARHLYNLNVRGHAMALAENALPNLPRQYFPDEYRMVEQWRQHPPPQEAFAPIACADCSYPNPAGTTHCAHCGARFLLDKVRGKSLPTGFARRVLAGWIAMMLAIGGIPLAASLGGALAVAVIFLITAGAVTILALAFRGGVQSS